MLAWVSAWSVHSSASDFHSPRTAALGGAGHAGPVLNDAIYLNPSFGSFMPTYSVSGNYLFFHGGSRNSADEWWERHGKGFNASLQDGRTDLFQAGVAYTSTEAHTMIHVGASRAVINRLGVGIGGKYVMPRAPGAKTFQDITLSTSFIATDWLHSVLVVDNVISPEKGRAQGFHREYILGTKVNIKSMLLLYFDPHLTPNMPGRNPYGYEFGMEIAAMSDLFLRLGMFRNSNVPFINDRGRGYGVGIGWMAPRISFDYGISRVIEPRNDVMQTLGLTIYF